MKKISKDSAWHRVSTHICWTNEYTPLFLDFCLNCHITESRVKERGVPWVMAWRASCEAATTLPHPFCWGKLSSQSFQKRVIKDNVRASLIDTFLHTHTHTIFPSKFYAHIFRVLLKLYLRHLIAISPGTWHSFTYCQWQAPYRILAKHARSPLHYWESPCSHSPSWFVGIASYRACIA